MFLYKVYLFPFVSLLPQRNFKISQLTPDLWTYLKCNKSFFSNQYFTEKHTILLPPLGQLLRGVSLWSDFFLRYSTVHSLPTLPSSLAKIMYKTERYTLSKMVNFHVMVSLVIGTLTWSCSL